MNFAHFPTKLTIWNMFFNIGCHITSLLYIQNSRCDNTFVFNIQIGFLFENFTHYCYFTIQEQIFEIYILSALELPHMFFMILFATFQCRYISALIRSNIFSNFIIDTEMLLSKMNFLWNKLWITLMLPRTNFYIFQYET